MPFGRGQILLHFSSYAFTDAQLVKKDVCVDEPKKSKLKVVY